MSHTDISEGSEVFHVLHDGRETDGLSVPPESSRLEHASERQMTEETLRLSEERFRVALKNSPIMVLHQDSDLRYLWACNMHPAFSPGDILGKTDAEILGASEAEQITAVKRAVLKSGKGIRHEQTFCIEGRARTYDLTIEPFRNAAGTVTGLTIAAVDVTEQKRKLQQQIRLHELTSAVNHAEALPQIYDAALDAILEPLCADRASILLYDADQVMRFRAWRGLSDRYRQAVEGHSPWAPNDPAPQPVTISDIGTVPLDPHLLDVITKEGIRALAFIPLTYEGKLLGKFMVYYNNTHVFTEDELLLAQTIAGQVGFAIARKQLEELLRSQAKHLEKLVQERTARLEETVQELERFSYSISHDMRAPLRAMQGFARLLIEEYADKLDDEAKDYLDRIHRASVRQDKLIQDVLSYSRLIRQTPAPEIIQLEKLIRETIEQYPNLQARNAQIQIETPLPDVFGNEALLTQCLSNLLDNAIKFVPAGKRPRIIVRASDAGSFARLWIEDNGVGIAPEHQVRIFEMFERIYSDREFEGSGIGLTVVRKAIERMGGRVGVESSAGEGSRFWIELPRVPGRFHSCR